MPSVSTVISYEHEEGAFNEVSTYRRDVQDLDPYDWAYYLMKITEVMGFNVKQVNVIMEDNRVYGTEL